ncbi:MAG: hypothetical protein IKW90_11405 [Lachnospiraceae bacterium]|nr:hypothetical protein [Lachnospiraceae bacterium]
MVKKLLFFLASLAMVLAGINVKVSAADTCTVICYPYTIYGSCYITQTSAGVTTYSIPITNVYVIADYYYIVDPSGVNPSLESVSSNIGGEGSVFDCFIAGGNRQSYYIRATHGISGCSAVGYTEAYYLNQ